MVNCSTCHCVFFHKNYKTTFGLKTLSRRVQQKYQYLYPQSLYGQLNKLNGPILTFTHKLNIFNHVWIIGKLYLFDLYQILSTFRFTFIKLELFISVQMFCNTNTFIHWFTTWSVLHVQIFQCSIFQFRMFISLCESIVFSLEKYVKLCTTENVYMKFQILVYEYWTTLHHFYIPVLWASE